VSLFVSGKAQAGPDASSNEVSSGLKSRLKYGEITNIESKTFTIKLRDGGGYSYLVDGNTRFRIWGVNEPGFSDLEPGAFVFVASKIEGDELVATVVAIMPEDFNPSSWFGIRVRGEVIDVDNDSGTINVLDPTGEEIEIHIGSRTRYLAAASSLEELEVGWFVEIVAGEQGDGSYKATVLASSENPLRVRNTGLVTAVDLDSSTVSISTHRCDEISFSVDTNTKFYSREKKIEGLSDLDVDMVVVVVARYQTDRSFLATQIATARAEDLTICDVKTGDRINEIGAGYFTILSRSGEEVNFKVDSETKFHVRGIDVQSLDDLELGMIALVGADSAEDGDMITKLIIVIQYSYE